MKKALLFLFILSVSSTYAQDIHWSQFNSSIQNLNPAQVGLFDGDWRFAGNLRDQWSAIPVPYRTYAISADTRLKTPVLPGAMPAAGIQINSDKAGDSKFQTTQVLLSGSYIRQLTKDSTKFVSVAIQPGFTTRNFNLGALTFDNQYIGDVYNPAVGSGENFAKTRISYFDIGLGAAYLWKKKEDRTMVNGGFSVLHLTKPKQTFFNDSDIKLDMKTNLSVIAQIPVAEKIDVMPSLLYQRQGKFQETVVGAFGKYHLAPIDGKPTAVALGTFFRVKDAFIIAANMDYKSFNVGISYDVNVSKLNEATNYRGGFELSVIYIFKKLVPFVSKSRVCPIYM